MVLPKDRVLIVGAGCFGLSTAYHLLKRGFENITVLEKADQIPAPDAASNDINRIVRSSYADPFYAELGKEAIAAWKELEFLRSSYHESGVVVLGSGTNYVEGSYDNDVAIGARVQKLSTPDDMRKVFPQGVVIPPSVKGGYLNKDGGWANAGQATGCLAAKVEELGGTLLTGKTVKELLRRDGRTYAVRTQDGAQYEADLFVIATGSWTPSAFPQLKHGSCVATGHSVAMIRLTPEEAEIYRDTPVVFDLSTGFYTFPPNENNILKVATHVAGFTHDVNGVSSPRTITSHPEDGLLIPKSELNVLKQGLASIYPELTKKPIIKTRLCWYNDTIDEDWVISIHPDDSGLLFATGDSGHALKFLPVIGRLMADLAEGKMEERLVKKFSLDRQTSLDYISRDFGTERVELGSTPWYEPEDLLGR